MKNNIILAGLLCAALASHTAALDLSVGAGSTGEGTNYFRLGGQQPFDSSWWQSRHGRLTGYWDAAFSYWQARESQDNQSLSLSPVLVYQFNGDGIRPFIEAGIGLAAFRHTRVDDHQLGSALQMEDRLGVGLRLGDGHTLGLRAIHYSNGGLQQPNDGIEGYSLYYQWQY